MANAARDRGVLGRLGQGEERCQFPAKSLDCDGYIDHNKAE